MLLLQDLKVSPKKLRLGERMNLSYGLKSTVSKSQRLVVDYTVHYVKKSGTSSAKLFKLKKFTLPAGESVAITRRQVIHDFATRVHHTGRHEVDVVVNAGKLGSGFFELV